MRHDVSTATQRIEIEHLSQAAAQFSRETDKLQKEFDQETKKAEQAFKNQTSTCAHEYQDELTRLEYQLTEELEASRLQFENQVEQLNHTRNQKSDESSRRRADEISSSKSDREATLLQLRDCLKNDIEATEAKLKKFLTKRRADRERLEELIESIQNQLERRQLSLQEIEPEDLKSTHKSSTQIKNFKQVYSKAEKQLGNINQWRMNRFIDGFSAISVPFIAAAILAYPVRVAVSSDPILWIPTVLIITIGITVAFRLIAQRWLTSKTRQQVPSLYEKLVEAATCLKQAKFAAKKEAKAATASLQDEYSRQVREVEEDSARRKLNAESNFNQTRDELEQTYLRQFELTERSWDQQTASIRARLAPGIERCKTQYATQSEALENAYRERLSEARERLAVDTVVARKSWENSLNRFQTFQKQNHELSERQRREWSPLLNLNEEHEWSPPSSAPSLIPLGIHHPQISTNQADANWELPAGLSFPDQASLLVKATDEGRTAAINLLQNAMLRMLMAIPPGKLRFTIFDPTGLGQNFSAFMHLADFDDRLINNRIWTETGHIQQRLADLTEHMENVIQKYLRNEYASIQEYNDRAGEVAEPFRVLVIANFPTHFSEEAIRRLVSIANSGARCGVYTLMSVDMNAQLPRTLQLSDLQTHANCVEWKDGAFHWEDDTLAHSSIDLDETPKDERITTIVKSVGRLAEDSNRVEVPFASVTPPLSEWWSADCSNELKIPIGRSGATQQQSVRLGRGTSQHVLVSGKTGSGKSTLLHALITNAAMIYSPEELEFYLIDFKKGVEFKPYADLQLPHARVVAIESEREFGLSVLQKLDEELRKRGDLFRAEGVQSLTAYRERNPEAPLPRILFIVDEFQEFFVADDKIAHRASLLLDRLVRQGRAFGMHLILGSQTLAGAYSLARSTIGQMAVRVALQCSASDAHLILSEENTAARLLGRPGEAIYNDANGLLEGNHPFQVVWLSDMERNDYLSRIAEKADQSSRPHEAPIVFEGHAAADLTDNPRLQELLAPDAPQDSARAGQAWLGAAVEIKDPTAAIFRPQSGANLLIVGQNQRLANGMLTSAIVSLIAGQSPQDTAKDARTQFVVLDGEHDQSNHARLSEQLQILQPFGIEFCGPRESVDKVKTILTEVRKRGKEIDQRFNPFFLLINDLGRFRDLQPKADEFGFSGFGEEKTDDPGKYLSEILREGPAVGVHTLVWADNYNNATRWFDRPVLRDFAYRVLFQMSATDSSNLMDSAAASHLGPYRAFFHDDDRGQHQKFRPYGPPTSELLDQVARWLNQRTVNDAQDESSTDACNMPTENRG